MTHTPGPWKTNGSHIYAPDGAIIATVANPGASADDYPLVANRDLMAAAPNLLRELEQCAVELTEAANLMRPTLPRVASLYDAAIERVRTTIVKATAGARP